MRYEMATPAVDDGKKEGDEAGFADVDQWDLLLGTACFHMATHVLHQAELDLRLESIAVGVDSLLVQASSIPILRVGALGPSRDNGAGAVRLLNEVVVEGLIQRADVIVRPAELEQCSIGRVRVPNLVAMNDVQQVSDCHGHLNSRLLVARCSVQVDQPHSAPSAEDIGALRFGAVRRWVGADELPLTIDGIWVVVLRSAPRAEDVGWAPSWQHALERKYVVARWGVVVVGVGGVSTSRVEELVVVHHVAGGATVHEKVVRVQFCVNDGQELCLATNALMSAAGFLAPTEQASRAGSRARMSRASRPSWESKGPSLSSA